MRYIVRDSHRTLKNSDKERMAEFFAEVKGMPLNDAFSQVLFCSDYFEKEFAVKWFEVIAIDNGTVAGYLRCLRYPDDITRWYIGDVHVRKAFRRQGIAEKMYKKVFEAIKEFPATKCVYTSVSRDNKASVALHLKLGFENAGTSCDFPEFCFDEKETAYKKTFIDYLPVPDSKTAFEMLKPVWREYGGSDDELNKLIDDSLSGKETFYTIWCGVDLIGIKFKKDGKEHEYTKG